MKSLREQSLETPRSGRRDRRKNLLATATSGRDSPALVKERTPAAAPEVQTDSPASPTVPEGGLSDLLASGQELMARLTGEGVSLACLFLLFRLTNLSESTRWIVRCLYFSSNCSSYRHSTTSTTSQWYFRLTDYTLSSRHSSFPSPIFEQFPPSSTRARLPQCVR